MDWKGQGKERNRDVLNGWEEVPESFWREINNNERKSLGSKGLEVRMARDASC